MYFSYIYSIYCNCKIKTCAEGVTTLHKCASENGLIEVLSWLRPRPHDAAPQFIQISDQSQTRLTLCLPSSSHQRMSQGTTCEKEQTRTGILPQDPAKLWGSAVP